MKVAFATTDGKHVDEHFGRAGRFAVYEFSKEGYTDLGPRVFAEGRDKEVELTKGMGEAHDAAVNEKVEKLSDCKVIYMTKVGGPSAARLVARGIMPVKVPDGTPINKLAGALMDTIATSPPPWMKKLLG